MNAIYRPPPAAPMIPENAPFSPEQRAWLNGFFAGLLSSDARSSSALGALEDPALTAALSAQNSWPATTPRRPSFGHSEAARQNSGLSICRFNEAVDAAATL